MRPTLTRILEQNPSQVQLPPLGGRQWRLLGKRLCGAWVQTAPWDGTTVTRAIHTPCPCLQVGLSTCFTLAAFDGNAGKVERTFHTGGSGSGGASGGSGVPARATSPASGSKGGG